MLWHNKTGILAGALWLWHFFLQKCRLWLAQGTEQGGLSGIRYILQKSLEITSEILSKLLGTHEVNDKTGQPNRRQLSTNIHEEKNWRVSLWKRPNRQNTNKHMQTYPSIAEMRIIWMPKTHQSQNSHSAFRFFQLTIGSSVFLIFLSILQQKNVTESFCISALSLPAFVTWCVCLTLHWCDTDKSNKRDKRNSAVSLNWGCEF